MTEPTSTPPRLGESTWRNVDRHILDLTAARDAALARVAELETANADLETQASLRILRLQADAVRLRAELAEAQISGPLGEVAAERVAQDAKWGEQNHPDGTGGPVMRQEAEEMRTRCGFLASLGATDWRSILLEEVYEALAEDGQDLLRTELVQVAAVAVAWIEAIDRRLTPGGTRD